MKRWNDIEGWFSHADAEAYAFIAKSMPDKGQFLEIGSYKGRSTMCMDSIAKHMGKDIVIDVVDTFSGDEHMGVQDTYVEFIENTKGCRLGTIYTGDSKAVHKVILDTYDAIFIDACHNTPDVIADIKNYMPFLNEGGILAGHDIHRFGVYPAVKSVIGDDFAVIGNCWIKSGLK